MSELSDQLLAKTSKPPARPALLVLEDGTAFWGTACGADGETFGEVCFNTSLEGYLEVVTDPSYAGQIVVMTYPQIGNYGVNLADAQAARPALRGLVVHDMCYTPSSWRSEMSLPDYLYRQGVVGIEGIDTRALVRHVRERGAMRAVLSTGDLDVSSLTEKAKAGEPIVGVNLVRDVSCREPYSFGDEVAQADSAPIGTTPEGAACEASWTCASALTGPLSKPRPATGKGFALAPARPARHRVVAYDCGAKRSILEGLVQAGCEVRVVPWNTPAADVLSDAPDGVFLSNGPGDPDAVSETYEQVEKLLGNVPVFGICLGHQMICKAAGARMEKLKYGHHGANQPVVNLLTGRVEITSQNHGFNLVFPSLGSLAPGEEGSSRDVPRGDLDDLLSWVDRGASPIVENPRYGKVRLTHVNLNDGTAEGIAFLDIPAFSVQYHPEANPGPTDSRYLFAAFTRLMDGREDYLDIDIAQERLEGWRF